MEGVDLEAYPHETFLFRLCREMDGVARGRNLELQLVTNVCRIISREQLGEVQLLGLPLFLQHVDVLHHPHISLAFVV